VTHYSPGATAGTVYAHDLTNGEVGLDVVTSAGAKFSIVIADPTNSLWATGFGASDFIFA